MMNFRFFRQLVQKNLCRCYSGNPPRDMLSLHERGIFQNVFPEHYTADLVRQLSNSLSVYCGFDPTADSLHIGNLLAIVGLLHCQRGGHQPICVVGGATGMIGDPSGRTKDRQPMSPMDIENNTIALTNQLNKIFANHEEYIWKHQHRKLKPVKVLNNAEWYKNEKVLDFLSKVGRSFRMGDLLSRESVKSRLSSEEGMNFTEFTYQIFQSYDWLQLYKQYNCIIQIGGNDQLGNIRSGYEFIQKCTGNRVFGKLKKRFKNMFIW